MFVENFPPVSKSGLKVCTNLQLIRFPGNGNNTDLNNDFESQLNKTSKLSNCKLQRVYALLENKLKSIVLKSILIRRGN